MLSKNQWQWLADHHQKVRAASIVFIIGGFAAYAFLIFQTIWEKGKSQIPYKPRSDFYQKFNCREKIEPFDMGPFGGNAPPKKGYYKDASIWKLERHETGMLEIHALTQSPECIGAILSDSANSQNPYVLILFDGEKMRPLYRIERIVGAEKK